MTVAKKDASGKPQFFEIKERALITKVFGVLVTHKIPVTMWLKNQTLKFDTIFTAFKPEIKMLEAQFPMEISEDRFTIAIEAQGSEDILASFQVDAVNFFFKSTYVQKTPENRLQIATPAQLYKLQRRANMRVPFTLEKSPELSMVDPLDATKVLSYRILDVSAGGIGITAGVDEKERFKIGTRVERLQFTMREMSITTDGAVKYVSTSKNEKGQEILKVGIQFDPLKPEQEKKIVQFVLEESRKFFSLLY